MIELALRLVVATTVATAAVVATHLEVTDPSEAPLVAVLCAAVYVALAGVAALASGGRIDPLGLKPANYQE